MIKSFLKSSLSKPQTSIPLLIGFITMLVYIFAFSKTAEFSLKLNNQNSIQTINAINTNSNTEKQEITCKNGDKFNIFIPNNADL